MKSSNVIYKYMAQFAPQYNLYSIFDKVGSISKIIFWAIFGFSFTPLLTKQFNIPGNWDDTINIFNIIAIALFFALEIVQQYILIPQADAIRRDDFIDNSFGSKFSTISSVGYYDNDEVPFGLYKAACNLFENCFFTYSLVKIITLKKVIFPAFVLLVTIASAYYGFKQVPFALTLLQTLFSANLLGDLLKHLILLTRLNTIKELFISLFQQQDLKANVNIYQERVYRLWLKYESLHSSIPAGIPQKIYNKYNPSLTTEWTNMKARYNIN